MFEDPHPQQLLSGLRVLYWIAKNHNVNSIALCGESAGGTLVTSLAILLSNPKALRHFSRMLREVYKLTDEDVSEWEYPAISGVTSWYGILDQHSWRDQGFLAWGLSFTVDAHRSRSPWPFSNDIRKQAQLCDFLTLVEACENGWVEQYPPLLLIAGSTDPLGLVHSSRKAKDVMKEKVRHLKRLEYHEYEAGHAFIGLNPFILVLLHGNKWRTELALPATFKTIEFIKQCLHA